jgi:hypothetical protein
MKVGSMQYEMLQLRLAMRTVRARYMENVRKGKVKYDPQALSYFDEQLESANARSKSISAKR